MKRVAIVQARMGSSRLPGKILADLVGRPMLARQIARMRESKTLDEIVIATTGQSVDDPVAELARSEDVRCFRGSEDDVLSRYVGAARDARADVVVRITADCPLIDPDVLDLVVGRLVDPAQRGDYASNTIERSYPRGLDVEALFVDVLHRMDRLGTSRAAREHVTYFLHRERPDLFVVGSVRGAADHSDLRWTVDTPEDLALIRAIYETTGAAERRAPYETLVASVRGDERLVSMNRGVVQKDS